MSKTILVVAAHPDDEVLGCGGTIARHVAEGDDVFLIFTADGVSSRIDSTKDDYDMRYLSCENATSILGISKSFFLGFPDNKLDTVPLLNIIQKIESVIDLINPSVVYTHHYGDLNIDHQITHKATITACRPMPDSSIREIYAFEVLSSTEWSCHGHTPFVPNFYVDISNFQSIKIDALNAYKLELRNSPHSRSINSVIANSIYRGHTVGFEFAESFMIMRFIR